MDNHFLFRPLGEQIIKSFKSFAEPAIEVPGA